MVSLSPIGCVRQAGSLFALCLDVGRLISRRPLPCRALAQQAAFVASVTILPTPLVDIRVSAVLPLDPGSSARPPLRPASPGAPRAPPLVRAAQRCRQLLNSCARSLRCIVTS